jgi:transcriptional antiterminator RfaH
MGIDEKTTWHLVRTKVGKERYVRDQLQALIPEAFLPLLKARVLRRSRFAASISPLFPCYVFARFDLQLHYFDVRYMAGVREIVSAGYDSLAIPPEIIAEIQRRGTNGIVEIPQTQFAVGDRVIVVDGPFNGFEAIFERYLSSAERVAILLNAVATRGLRVSLPASAVAKRI